MKTKFRAFQLDSKGSLFSFYKNNNYCLIEARIPKEGIEELIKDLAYHNKSKIDRLHITSWDTDHCCYDDLVQIINHFRPEHVEVPSYEPGSDEGKLCKKVIFGYERIHEEYIANVTEVSMEYLNGLGHASPNGTEDVIYPSSYNNGNKNDMSLIRLFRSEGFNVLSLGDCESNEIAESLIFNGSLIRTHVDVLILPHHGADNGFISAKFLDAVKPRIAICSSNYDNQYDHPRYEIRQLLYDRGINLYTTKTGDVWVMQRENEANVTNLISNNTQFSSQHSFSPKRLS